MSGIEWHETRELQPQHGSLQAFCLARGIDVSGLPTNGLLVLIEDEVLASLNDFLSEETTREHGGVLVGEPFWDPQRQQSFAVIHRAIPALDTQGSPVHLQFTPASWDYISGFIEEELPGMTVIGWHHSHPGLGVFMSGTDRGTQAAFFNHPWNVAVVVDPLARKTGWFSGKDCDRMTSGQVLIYPKLSQQEEVAVPSESQPSASARLARLRWLLPGSFLVLFLLAGIWLLVRNRFQTGSV